jgi:glutamyl-tRNA synthetase
LHLGHARTFWIAQERALARAGTLILRNEDLDGARCKAEFSSAMLQDLHWFGFQWDEGPDVGGAFAPYAQSQRMRFYQDALEKLREDGFIYRCSCSRQDVLRALQAPHAGEDEPIYPGTCRPDAASGKQPSIVEARRPSPTLETAGQLKRTQNSNWRFRVPDGEAISFVDGRCGPQQFVAGRDFGDFIVWRQDDVPSYQLAVVVDDAAMQITEVVRGEDLLKSTARQLLLYSALRLPAPQFYHCPLVNDGTGARLAKRHDALGLRTLRANGAEPNQLRQNWAGLELK